MSAIAITQRDADLMLAVRDGDESSFELLLDHYRAPVVRFLYRMVQNREAAEELAQEVFLRVYRARASYQPTAKFSTWLFCIATRQALNWRRDVRKEWGHESIDDTAPEKIRRELSDPRPTVEQTLLRGSSSEEIRAAVDALPPKQRAAVILHKYQELGYSQIAKSLRCSESAVKSLLFRAYGHLRQSLIHLASAS